MLDDFNLKAVNQYSELEWRWPLNTHIASLTPPLKKATFYDPDPLNCDNFRRFGLSWPINRAQKNVFKGFQMRLLWHLLSYHPQIYFVCVFGRFSYKVSLSFSKLQYDGSFRNSIMVQQQRLSPELIRGKTLTMQYLSLIEHATYFFTNDFLLIICYGLI